MSDGARRLEPDTVREGGRRGIEARTLAQIAERAQSVIE